MTQGLHMAQGGTVTEVAVSNDLALYRGDAVVVGVFEDDDLSPAGRSLDGALDGLLKAVLETGDMNGKRDRRALLYTHGRIPAPRILLVGLGKRDEADEETLRRASGDSGRYLRGLGVRTIGTTLHAGVPLDAGAAGEAIAEGSLLGLYRYTEHRTVQDDEPVHDVEAVTILDPDASIRDALAAGVEVGVAVAESANLARDLSNEPPNFLPPLTLAARARTMADEVGLKCRVLSTDELTEEGFNALLAVGRGSANPPAFIVLEHGVERAGPPIVFAGKGICFDSGGLSLKNTGGMASMKHDMSGAAAVIGGLCAVARLGVPRRVIGLVAAAENMPGGRAQRPGDVIYALGGKTIEVLNTDAEGRLVLADALAYASRLDPVAVVDLATLTGACVTALGDVAAGLFAPHGDEATDRLAERIGRSAEAVHERVWRMPLWEEYDEDMKSTVADVRNVGSGSGGAIKAAAFLKTFAEGYPWVHLDIAGMANTGSEKGYHVKGATGFGVRLLTHLVRRWDET